MLVGIADLTPSHALENVAIFAVLIPVFMCYSYISANQTCHAAPSTSHYMQFAKPQDWLTEEDVEHIYQQYDINKDGVIRCGCKFYPP